MNRSNSLIFFGNERLSSGFEPHGAPTLSALIEAGYDVKAIVANYERGQSRSARALEIEEVAHAHKIPVLLPAKLQDIKQELADLHADIGVLVAYGRIVPQDIIDMFPHGVLNIHPSLLPMYRGSTPIEQAILDGAGQTGVSVMGLVRQMDAGPIYAQQAIDLTGTETKQTLTETLLRLGGKLLLEALPSVLSGTARPTLQNEQNATFTHLIQKDDSQLDPLVSAEQLERQVRAYAVWPKSRTEVLGHPVIVTKAHVAQTMQDPLTIPCHPGFLQIDELIAPSGKKMTAADFLRGYNNKTA